MKSSTSRKTEKWRLIIATVKSLDFCPYQYGGNMWVTNKNTEETRWYNEKYEQRIMNGGILGGRTLWGQSMKWWWASAFISRKVQGQRQAQRRMPTVIKFDHKNTAMGLRWPEVWRLTKFTLCILWFGTLLPLESLVLAHLQQVLPRRGKLQRGQNLESVPKKSERTQLTRCDEEKQSEQWESRRHCNDWLGYEDEKGDLDVLIVWWSDWKVGCSQ